MRIAIQPQCVPRCRGCPPREINTGPGKLHASGTHTHCVLWSEKLPFAGYSVVKERRDSTCELRQQSCANPRTGSQNLVENTGLEPVTSWLQTRRSPS